MKKILKENIKDVRVNFMLEKEKHKDLLVLSRISGKSITEILTDYVNKIISENQSAIAERREIEARLNDSLKF